VLARLATLAIAAGCSRAEGGAAPASVPLPVAPGGCRVVTPGEPLQALLDDASSGAALCLAAGRYTGPVRIARSVTVWGPRDAVIAGGPGSIITITGRGATLAGVTVDGTGGSFDRLDAAVKVNGTDIRVEGVAIDNAVYGVLVEASRRVHVVGNHVRGSRDAALGLRGDSIRLWETRDSEIAGNVVEDGRDVVVWYSRGNRITDNQIVGGRYGAHFMYSHDNLVERNRFRGGVVGVFAMYSHGLVLRDNVIADAAGAAGIGIGLKESGNVEVVGNALVHDAVGLYIDMSPLQLGDTVVVRGNALRADRTAIVFHASPQRITIEDNDLADNDVQVRVDGGGDAIGAAWAGNYYDDYTGYDLDGDGVGDVPYELRSLSAQMIGEHAELALFHGTPALDLVDAASHLDPLFQPQLVLADPHPRMASHVEVP
jgi:nitrous oxidase accessory protein